MKKSIIFCQTFCLLALFLTACSNKQGTSTASTNAPAPVVTTPPASPDMDTQNRITADMGESTEEATPGVIIDGCQELGSVKKGKTLQILLPATAGTGYVWTLAKTSTILRQIRADDFQYKKDPKADPNMVGAQQKQILKFRAAEAGTETIDLIYSRSFEKNKIEKKCTINITVK